MHSACSHFICSIHNSHSWKFPEQLIHTLTTDAAATAPECANVSDRAVCDRACGEALNNEGFGLGFFFKIYIASEQN